MCFLPFMWSGRGSHLGGGVFKLSINMVGVGMLVQVPCQYWILVLIPSHTIA